MLVNSGAEAVENAVKIARQATGRPAIICFEGGFHGRTLLAMTLTAKNWRGKPLVTHQVIVELIAATTTRTGLTVRSRIDSRTYAKGRRISDTALAGVNLEPDEFHGEWNYTIHPAGR